MNTKIKEQLDSAAKGTERQIESIGETMASIRLATHLLESLEGEVSDSVDVNAYGGTIWITVQSREDLQYFLRLAPRWEKSDKEVEGAIAYKADIFGIRFSIHAHDAALPPTCKVVEEEYEIPASPARMSTRKVIKCNQNEDVPTDPSAPLDNGAPISPPPSEVLSSERSLVEIQNEN